MGPRGRSGNVHGILNLYKITPFKVLVGKLAQNFAFQTNLLSQISKDVYFIQGWNLNSSWVHEHFILSPEPGMEKDSPCDLTYPIVPGFPLYNDEFDQNLHCGQSASCIIHYCNALKPEQNGHHFALGNINSFLRWKTVFGRFHILSMFRRVQSKTMSHWFWCWWW